jgi:hypothetical protein
MLKISELIGSAKDPSARGQSSASTARFDDDHRPVRPPTCALLWS